MSFVRLLASGTATDSRHRGKAGRRAQGAGSAGRAASPPSFGRRSTQPPSRAPPRWPSGRAAGAAHQCDRTSGADLALAHALPRPDRPAAIATMTPDRLAPEVERLLGDRHRAAHPAQRPRAAPAGRASWSTTCSASARWSRCWRTTPSTTSWSTAPISIFVERARQGVAVRRPVPRYRAPDQRLPAHRRRRSAAASTRASPMVDARLKDGSPRQHRVPAAGAGRPVHLDPQVRQASRSTSPSWSSSAR